LKKIIILAEALDLRLACCPANSLEGQQYPRLHCIKACAS